MNLFIESHQQLLKKLIENKVDFIIIGGYSVIFYGYQRTTGDVDIWIKPDNSNKEKLLPVLEYLGIAEEDIQQIARLDFSKHLAFSFDNEPEKIEFLTRINLVEYDEADKMKVVADVDGLQIPFLHLNHLVLSKMNTGRLKDQADVQKLQQIQNAGNSKA
jgi:predicted nucleotidyltransferase